MNVQFIAIELLRALITLWLIVTFAFVMLRLSGDPIGVRRRGILAPSSRVWVLPLCGAAINNNVAVVVCCS